MNLFVKDTGRQTIRGIVFRGLVVAHSAWIAGCAQPVVPPSDQGTTDVIMKDSAFDPHDVTINRGEKVRWINEETGLVLHTSTSGDPDNPDLLGRRFQNPVQGPLKVFVVAWQYRLEEREPQPAQPAPMSQGAQVFRQA